MYTHAIRHLQYIKYIYTVYRTPKQFRFMCFSFLSLGDGSFVVSRSSSWKPTSHWHSLSGDIQIRQWLGLMRVLDLQMELFFREQTRWTRPLHVLMFCSLSELCKLSFWLFVMYPCIQSPKKNVLHQTDILWRWGGEREILWPGPQTNPRICHNHGRNNYARILFVVP